MKTFFRIVAFLMFVPASAGDLFGQVFVSQSNEWYISDCCYIFINGNTNCDTYNYWFSDTVTIDSVPYLKLNTNSQSPLFGLGKYYREENGIVFMRKDITEEEVKIYNFNLNVGEEFEIKNTDFGWSNNIKISSIDSVTLNSGEKRKRLNFVLLPDTLYTSSWIEGIGGVSAPMNPAYMLTLDCWTSLNCFRKNGAVEYQLGDCQLTAVENVEKIAPLISCSPNPAKDLVRFNRTDRTPLTGLIITVTDTDGRTVWQSAVSNADNIVWQTADTPPGIYIYTIRDGSVRTQSGRISIIK